MTSDCFLARSTFLPSTGQGLLEGCRELAWAVGELQTLKTLLHIRESLAKSTRMSARSEAGWRRRNALRCSWDIFAN